MKLLPIVLASLFLTTLLSAQLQDGHEVILTSQVSTGLSFLGLDGSYQPGPSLGSPGGLVYDPTTDAIFQTNDNGWSYTSHLYSYNPHTHVRDYIGEIVPYWSFTLACHPATGELYCYADWGSTLYHLDKQTAALTPIGSAGSLATLIATAAFHPHTHELYAIQFVFGGNTWDVVRVDLATGASTAVTTLDRAVDFIAFDKQGNLLGLAQLPGLPRVFELLHISIQTGTTQVITTYPDGTWLHDLTTMPAAEMNLKLSSYSPVGGQSLFVGTTGGKAAAQTWLTWSLNGLGSTVVPQLGVTLGLAPPIDSSVLGLSRLDGRVGTTITLPPVSGVQVWMQGVQTNLVSDVVNFTIQ